MSWDERRVGWWENGWKSGFYSRSPLLTMLFVELSWSRSADHQKASQVKSKCSFISHLLPIFLLLHSFKRIWRPSVGVCTYVCTYVDEAERNSRRCNRERTDRSNIYEFFETKKKRIKSNLPNHLSPWRLCRESDEEDFWPKRQSEIETTGPGFYYM